MRPGGGRIPDGKQRPADTLTQRGEGVRPACLKEAAGYRPARLFPRETRGCQDVAVLADNLDQVVVKARVANRMLRYC